MKSSPVRVPSIDELRRLQEVGREVGYKGFHIYLRYRAILELIDGMRFRRALNVGCGYGIFDRLLPSDLEYEGLDPEEHEIEVARAWARAERPKFRYVRARLAERDYEPGSFDFVLISEVLEHMSEAEATVTLESAVQALEPGGHLVVTVPNHLHLRNRVRLASGLSPVWMDSTHRREYQLEEARVLLDGLPVRLERFESAVLYFPLESWVAVLLPPESRLRTLLASKFPSVASHFLMLAVKLE